MFIISLWQLLLPAALKWIWAAIPKSEALFFSGSGYDAWSY